MIYIIFFLEQACYCKCIIPGIHYETVTWVSVLSMTHFNMIEVRYDRNSLLCRVFTFLLMLLCFMSQLSDSLHNTLLYGGSNCEVQQRVNETDNDLGAGDMFPFMDFNPYTDPDLYAVEKELYLGSLCKVLDSQEPWQFWMIMVKNGNFDKNTTLCPENGKNVSKIVTDRNFPCFGKGCMNQPLVYHNYSRLVSFGDQVVSLTGGFYGTYELDANLSKAVDSISYFSVSWQKNLSTGSWIFSHKLTTSSKYPWLMLYLRSDATKGFNGGYHYDGRGIMRKVCSFVLLIPYQLFSPSHA